MRDLRAFLYHSRYGLSEKNDSRFMLKEMIALCGMTQGNQRAYNRIYMIFKHALWAFWNDEIGVRYPQMFDRDLHTGIRKIADYPKHSHHRRGLSSAECQSFRGLEHIGAIPDWLQRANLGRCRGQLCVHWNNTHA